MTFIAALRCDWIDAPCVLDQPFNGQSFTVDVEQCLVPTLSPGDIVIMDNLSSHKRPDVRKAIRSAGARLRFLPRYSPDLNPIEKVFAKLKHLLHKAAERSHEATWHRIGALLTTRAQLVRMRVDLANQVRGVLKPFDLVAGKGGGQPFVQRVRILVANGPLQEVAEALLSA